MELAAEMAELFAFGLLQDCAPADLCDPHSQVSIDGGPRITLHDILFELRSLPWYDRATPDCLGQPEALARRATRLTSDGEFTLSALLQAGVPAAAKPGFSAFLRADHSVAQPMPERDVPGPSAPMSAWVEWCARRSGAGLQLPGRGGQTKAPRSLAEMAAYVQAMPPARPFHNAALAALARGVALNAGTSWTGSDLFGMMAEAECRAIRIALLQAGRTDRLARPAVTAARLSVALSLPSDTRSEQVRPIECVADILAEHTPRLLQWMSRANRYRRGPQRTETSLFLPLCTTGTMLNHPSDVATHMMVAGALATLVKAGFDTARRTPLHMVGQSGPELALAAEADRLVADIATARLVSGGYFPAENIRDMRLGQSLALQVMREKLESDNRAATVTFSDLDGRSLRLDAQPCLGARAHVGLFIDGLPMQWPYETGPAAPHLTAVI